MVGASDNSGVALGTGKLDWPTIMRRSGQASVKRDLIEVKSTAREQSTGDQTISVAVTVLAMTHKARHQWKRSKV